MAGINSYLVRAGTLRHALTFQRKSTAQDDLGQPQNVWVDAFKCRGEVSPVSGRELLAAQAVQTEVTHTISVRYRPELQNPKEVAAMRVLFGSRVFDINASMNQDERNRLVMLQAKEGISNG
ncbi:phage head closure protein [Burkholderia vietnamiensis]|uniref:phage head closure protein n=1 Tax=Burkholderia vietnamiensis TaxID=60552 RepID=UPI0011275A65|nr:phage head closure protein [Burkholderia vietnamiensis]MDN8038566.1 phage head closure protein [Burkholderia vietnamiensis]TPQ43357.1 head-tail adaptor protein [Burkholderia ubonensis]HDR9185282.1 phage head closure protein [Burkholderia vietnamiensis]